MKIQCLSIVAVLLISACASQPAYKPASASGYGYKETEISDNRYRVQFKARGDNRDKAMDYALLRSAELTLLKGYDWFVVVDRETVVDRDQPEVQTGFSNGGGRVVTQSCGLLGCTTTSQPTAPTYTVATSTGSTGTTETVMEIRMGKGVRPSAGDSYDALDVRDKLESKAR